MHMLLLSHATAPLLVLLLMGTANLLAWPYTAAIQDTWFREDQPVETLTWIGYCAAAAWLSVWAVRHPGERGFHLHSGLALLLLAGREQDAHKWLTHGESPLKTAFFVDPQVSTGDKLTGLVVALVFIGVLASYAWRYWRPLLAGLHRGSVAHASAALAVAMLPLSKFFDTLPRLLRDSGHEMERWLHRATGINEESFELLIPLVVLLALWQRHATRDQGG